MTLLFIPRSGTPDNAVKMGSHIFFSIGTTGTIYSGVRFGADGSLYERQPAGGWSRFGTWLYNGTASTYYLSRSIDAGTLTTDAGAGPLQMNSNRDYDIQLSSNGSKTTSVTFDISDDVSGSPVIDTQTWTFNIERGLL